MSDDEMMWNDDGEMDADEDADAEEEEEEDEDTGKKAADGKGKNQNYKWENIYFQAKDMMEDEPEKAIKEFDKIVKGETPPGEWSYRALKRLVRLQFQQAATQGAAAHKAVLAHYSALLAFQKSVTENVLFKGMNKCLDVVSNSTDLSLITAMYDASFAAMKSKDSTWFKTKLKLAKLLLEREETAALGRTLEELKQSCMDGKGALDPKKGSNLIDIYALEIQLALASKDRKRTQDIYHQALAISKANPGILNSRLAIFHFCGGKILMEQHNWEGAYSSFQEAFRFFEEAGNALKLPCLKYLLLANMLRLSKIDPFNSPETANLRNHKEIAPMANLAVAYANNDIKNFERILSENKKSILGDPFIANFLTDLLREVRTQVLQEVIKPYARIHLPFLAKELNISTQEVESLMADLILDGKIAAQIDQVQQLVRFRESGAQASTRKFAALSKWTTALASTQATLAARVH